MVTHTHTRVVLKLWTNQSGCCLMTMAGVAAVSYEASVRRGQVCRQLPAAECSATYSTCGTQVPTDAGEMAADDNATAALWRQVMHLLNIFYKFISSFRYTNH